MANETKIGLLVGMCFIVCFAIILSHRGTPRADDASPRFEIENIVRDAPPPVLEPPSGPSQRTARQTPAPRTRSRQHQSASQETLQSSNAQRSRSADAQRSPLDDPAPTTAVNAVNRFQARGRPIAAPTPTDTTESAVVLPRLDADDSTGEPLRLNMPETRHEDAEPSVEETMQPWMDASRRMTEALAYAREHVTNTARLPEAPRLRGETTATDIATTLGADTPAASRVAMIGTHEVVSGDTLSRIARQHYGSDDKAIVDAIFAANRDRMDSPDEVKLGWTLALPQMGDRAGAASAPQLAEAREEPADRGVTVNAASPAARYEVQSGDALSRIAEQHYGTSRGPVMQAILAANADWLKDADHLIAGRTLVLPAIDGLDVDERQVAQSDAAPRAAAERTQSSARPARTERASADDPVAWRWYQLKKGEVYSTVAASQMGSARRWKELAELNRDIFPDPDHIRYGVRIRVPVEGSRVPTSQAVGEGA